MSPPGDLSSAAETLTTALQVLASFLESHGPACVCTHCLALHAGQDAAVVFADLAIDIEARAREEWTTHAMHQPYTELLHGYVGR